MNKTFAIRGRILSLNLAVALFAAIALPIFMGQSGAAEMNARSLTIPSAIAGASTQTYTYGFTTTGAAVAVQSIGLKACTTPLGACTSPTGIIVDAGTEAARSGWTNATTFTRDGTGAGSCLSTSDNILCLTRTEAATETAGARTLGWNTQTNPSDNTQTPVGNNTFFVRIVLYSDTAWATAVHNGVVAAAVVPALTVSARVQEVLNFCIGSTTVNDGTTSPGADCSNISGTTVDIGIVDTTTTGAVSPDSDGNSFNGVAMLRTNANTGTSIGYKAVQAGTGTEQLGSLRVTGATCNASAATFTDQCFRSFSTETALSASVEQFGMTARFVNVGSSATPTAAVTRAADYDFGSSGYSWDASGSLANIANASGPTDDEALILKFAAVAAITTPTGSYTVQGDFIATPTY